MTVEDKVAEGVESEEQTVQISLKQYQEYLLLKSGFDKFDSQMIARWGKNLRYEENFLATRPRQIKREIEGIISVLSSDIPEDDKMLALREKYILYKDMKDNPGRHVYKAPPGAGRRMDGDY